MNPARHGPPTDPPEEASDEAPKTVDLVRDAQDGAAAGMAALYERVAPSVFAWASLKIPGALRGRLDPEDVVQETWLVALRKFAAFDPARSAFRTWIFGVANHVLMERFRGLRKDEARRAADALSEVPDAVTSLSRRLVRDEALTAFLGEVGALAEDERALIVYCGLEGLTASAVGEIVGASQAAVEKRWQRLRAKLREGVVRSGLVA